MTESTEINWHNFWQEVRSLANPAGSVVTSDAPLGVPAAAHSFLLSSLGQQSARSLLVVAADDDRADLLVQEIRQWTGDTAEGAPGIFFFAKPDARAFERIPWTGQTRQSRLTALVALLKSEQKPCIVVSSVTALMQKTLPPSYLADSLQSYAVGESHQMTQITRFWVEAGYTSKPNVESAGTFARRGSILDIWPANLLYPVRFDFMGDEIETLRFFDPQTQRSRGVLKEVDIGPASEALSRQGPELLKRVGLRAAAAHEILEMDPQQRGPLQDPAIQLYLQQEIVEEVEKLAGNESFPEIEWYLPYLYAESGCLLDFLVPGGVLLLDDGADCEQAMKAVERKNIELQSELIQSGDLPVNFASAFFSYDEILERVAARKPVLLGHGDLEGRKDAQVAGVGRYFKGIDLQRDEQTARPASLKTRAQTGTRVIIVSKMAAKVVDMMEAVDLYPERIVGWDPNAGFPPGGVQLWEGTLHGGFSVVSEGEEFVGHEHPILQVITDLELFDIHKTYKRRRTPTHQGITPEQFFAEVNQGDHVVHVDFGIGCYAGLVNRRLKGLDTEFIQVDFLDGDKVLVPVHQANRVGRYVGSEDPVLSRLGSTKWATAKAKVKEEVQEIANDLLRIYAEREMAVGKPIRLDDAMQQALELSFEFEETADQLVAIKDVKVDLEAPRHMDRLVVGDVGFGKTEVAIRAAFKVVLDGRQVAVLAPTTVLAHQHYTTFSRRMQKMPVHIEVLSRLRSPAERRRAKEQAAQGQADIVIGTHALLSNDMKFKDLGLLVIDEEQRFGVKQKERIKRLKPSVNVLTMSATPIPRTMNMGLSGIRDISYITTPPESRMPVHTVSAPYDETLVRRALGRELGRGGQAFVVTDRIRGIVALADQISHLAPGATIDIAHGRMKGEELEDAMLRFSESQTDILVCTTLIENGLDIPNANTIVINNADRFGMAQLYQLRGRVGRSFRRGHCYLLYADNRHLNFAARSRLQHIVEASDELGAGFRIAMSDLQLRGAGEILGARQSGSMGTIGLDLFSRMLANEVADLQLRKATVTRSEEEKARLEAQVKQDPFAPAVTFLLPLEARIPEWYIEDAESRYRFYHRIAGLKSEGDADEFRKELIDRFGSVSARVDAVPEEIENLLYLIKVRQAAEAADIESIAHQQDALMISPRSDIEAERHVLNAYLKRDLGPHLSGDTGSLPPFRVRRDGVYLQLGDDEQWKHLLLSLLASMASYRQPLADWRP